MMIFDSERELLDKLQKIFIPNKTLIIGLGNELRCDDAFGIIVSRDIMRLLGKNKKSCIEVIEASTNPEAYIEELSRYRNIVIIDTIIHSSLKPSSNIIILKLRQINLNYPFLSTHMINLWNFLSNVKRNIYLIGIYPKCLDYDIKTSEEANQAITLLVKSIYKTIISKCNLTE